MNKAEVLSRVSQRSGVDIDNCKKVLDAFEEVLSDELTNSKSVGNAFDKIYNLLTILKGKKGG